MSSRGYVLKYFNYLILLLFVLSLSLIYPAKAEFLDNLFGDVDAGAYRSHQTKSYSRHSRSSFSIRSFREGHSRPHARTEVRRQQNHNNNENSHEETSDKTVRKDKYAYLALCVPHEEKQQVHQSGNSIIYDKTLRRGDSVMTHEGVHVFKGQDSCPHAKSDFEPLKSVNTTKKHGKDRQH